MLPEGKRSFKIAAILKGKSKKPLKFKNNQKYTGRYISKDPHGAASKAFTRYCRNEGLKQGCKMVVIMKESTSGSSKKMFAYNATRSLKPSTIDDIEHRYKNKLKATDVPAKLQ